MGHGRTLPFTAPPTRPLELARWETGSSPSAVGQDMKPGLRLHGHPRGRFHRGGFALLWSFNDEREKERQAFAHLADAC